MAQTKQIKEHPFLFSSLPMGLHTLKNRLVALPVHTGFARPDGRVSPWMIDFYTRLAASGVGMVVVANAAVSSDGVVSRFNLRADKDRFIPGLARLASGIKAKGALACLQLNHAGRFAKTPRPLLPSPIIAGNLSFNLESLKEFMEFFPFEKRFSLTRYLLSQVKTWGRPMTEEDRVRVIQDFGSAASRARHAGFDMVELHGANGYLLCQYLSKFTNKLKSGFGGDFSSRTTFPLAVIREIKKRVPRNLSLGFRLMLTEWVPTGIDPDQALAFARCLEKEGMAYVSVSAATYNSLFSPEVLKKMAGHAYLEKETAALTKELNIPTVISGRITTANRAERILQKGAADLIGLGRSLRADPQWMVKSVNPGRKIIPCINCNGCLKQVVLEKGFNCRQWPGWIRLQTRLEHKLLTRQTSTLWIITDSRDFEIFKAYQPLLFPTGGKEPGPRFLFLSVPHDNSGCEAFKQDLLTWIGNRSDTACLSGPPEVLSVFEPRDSWENTVHNEIDQGEYGRIFLAARPEESWRKRLLYRTRGKMTALLNTNTRPHRVLVLVDLSETTLLVLRVLHQTLMTQPLFSFDFIHVETGQETGAGHLHTWKEAKKITGISETIPLKRILTKTDVVSALAPLIRERGYGTIIMGKRGISGIKRWLLGSVSAGLLRHISDQSIVLID